MFVTFEGPEGAGKSTAIRGVAGLLRARGLSVVETREPGAGELGKRIRHLLLEPSETPMPDRCELFLFLADRAQNVVTLIEPALERGELVLCDRFADSTLVYQGYARGLDLETLREMNRFATGGRSPDLTLLLDVEPDAGLARIAIKDRLDSESLNFHRAVRDGFLAEARIEPARWRVIDASVPIEAVIAACHREILDKLGLP